MGLFRFSKPKIDATELITNFIDSIVSTDFKEVEKKFFLDLKKENSLFGESVDLDIFIKKRQQVCFRLADLAWNRTVSERIFVMHSFSHDNRSNDLKSDIYRQCLLKAKQNNMTTFEYISNIFTQEIIPSYPTSDKDKYLHIVKLFEINLTGYYSTTEKLIKQYKTNYELK